MSYLLGQLDPHGYALTEVTVGPGPGAQIVSHPEPRPAVQVTAVIDTGANHSAISPDVIKALGIEPMATAEVDRIGVAGAVIGIYPVRIAILATEGTFNPFDVAAAGVRPSTHGADVIIGLDILQEFTFTYRGPRRLSDFTLLLEDPATPPARHERAEHR
jgi:predicted aspartyl protease